MTVCECPVDVAAGHGHFSMVPKRTWACPSHCSPGVVDCSGTASVRYLILCSANPGVECTPWCQVTLGWRTFLLFGPKAQLSLVPAGVRQWTFTWAVVVQVDCSNDLQTLGWCLALVSGNCHCSRQLCQLLAQGVPSQASLASLLSSFQWLLP